MKRIVCLLALLLTACVNIPTPAQRRGVADTLAQSHGWTASPLIVGEFTLAAYLPVAPVAAARLTIYIEGDGLAWITGTQVSSDPTPNDPLALRLALAQAEGAVAYLGRPCQYVDASATGCPSRYWTNARFAPEVIAATDRAVDILKQRFSATRLTLVGYSGGAAVAALVAARRGDVDRLVTVAGNLDHAAWSAYQRISPLTGSLNPVDHIDALRRVRQRHFVGGKDDNITPALLQQFAQRFTGPERPVVVVEPQFDHHCCWVQAWPALWQQTQK